MHKYVLVPLSIYNKYIKDILPNISSVADRIREGTHGNSDQIDAAPESEIAKPEPELSDNDVHEMNIQNENEINDTCLQNNLTSNADNNKNKQSVNATQSP